MRNNTEKADKQNSPQNRGLKLHSLPRWAWFLWIGFDLCLEAYVVHSTQEVWPHLLVLALIGATAVLFGSFYVTAHSYDKLELVRQRAVNAMLAITVACIINVLIHGWVSRSYSTKAQKRAEEMELMQATASIASRERSDMAKLLAAQADFSKANSELEKAAAIRSDSDRRYFRTTGIRRGGAGAPSGQPPAINFKPTEIAKVEASAADEAEKWQWWIYIGFALELIAAIGGATYVKKATQMDLNNNGILDSEEEQPAQSQERPSLWRRLTGRSGQTGQPLSAPSLPANASQDEAEAFFNKYEGKAPDGALINHPIGSERAFMKIDGRWAELDIPYSQAKAEMESLKAEAEGKQSPPPAQQVQAEKPAAKVRAKSAGANFDIENEVAADVAESGPRAVNPESTNGQAENGPIDWDARPHTTQERAKIFGITLPIVEGYRYEGKKKRGRVEVWSATDNRVFVASIGKKMLTTIAELEETERFQIVRDYIAAAAAKKSERDFETGGAE